MNHEYTPGAKERNAMQAASRITEAIKNTFATNGETVTISLDGAMIAVLNLETCHYSENDVSILRR